MKKICKCGVCGRYIPYYQSSRAQIIECVFSPKRGSDEITADQIFLCKSCSKNIYSTRKKTKIYQESLNI